MTALVTGAAGFIGSTLVRSLTSRGITVRGVDNFDSYYDPSLKERNAASLGHPDFTLVRADLSKDRLEDVLEGVSVIYHLAGRPGVRGSWGRDFDFYTAANITATQRLLEYATASARPPRIVYASSSSVYGDAEIYPTHETARPSPRSPYGVTKLAGEHLCSLYAANFGVPTVALRFFTVYGPRQRPDMAFTRFLRAALTREPVPLYGSGEQVRDFTYVGDIVRAIAAAGEADVPAGSVLNVSGGGSHSVNEVLDVIERLVGTNVPVDRRARADGDVMRTGADTRSITELLGWRPRVSLEDGLAAQLAWVREAVSNGSLAAV
ncbi:GDP-mannose 4,6-dehydratase [Microbacterium limosum]|uniref:GDP-mannose 4,6-dehydratase n=1 Tax=Microbacterium limosum TaxID=3079935 RepID=A0AAU0MG42_9MICO|nr:NAD-dependent epimerase/dehydratase family protein [Microbacterium sp. Y20]WOQ68807.1 GDP-mannose 4,6-dehydratase [Microbacterium sp. Y20]